MNRPGSGYSSTDSISSAPNTVDWIVGVLLIIGGLNWGLVGLFNVDLVAAIFGPMSFLSRAVYIIVGLSAVYWIVRGPMRKRARLAP